MSLVTSFNTEENFWSLNPQFKNIRPFKRLHDSDKSRHKTRTSNIMWFISQALDDHSENIFKNIPFEERLVVLSQDFLGDIEYHSKNEEMLEPLLSAYTKMHTTPARQALIEWQEKMVQRSAFIKATDYTLDTFEMDPSTGKPFVKKGTAAALDTMMKNSKGIYDLYHDILKSLATEDEENQVKGGQTLSLSDIGGI